MQRGVQFLDEQLALLAKAGAESSSNSISSSNAPLAEVALIVVLPDGSTMRGAFAFDESIENVYEWVDICRTDGRAREDRDHPPPFTLSIAYPQRDLPCAAGPDGKTSTLKSLGLTAREKLIIKKSAREDAPGAFQDNPTERLEREAAMEAAIQEKRDRETAARMAREAERLAQKKERMQALSSFNEDRDGANRRSSYQVLKMTKGDRR
eukprot:g4379.t1